MLLLCHAVQMTLLFKLHAKEFVGTGLLVDSTALAAMLQVCTFPASPSLAQPIRKLLRSG